MTKTRKTARPASAATHEQTGDEKILTLFREWCELQRQSEAENDEAKSDKVASRRDAVEIQIHHTPTTSSIGLAIKGYFLGYYHADGDPAISEAALTYGEDGEIEHWDSRAVKSFVDDAVLLVPELRTFVARIIDAPVRLPPGTVEPKKAELRARAEALAAEYSAPLPDGDAGLIEAERRHREIRQQTRSLYREFKIDVQTEADIIIGIIDPVRYRMSDFIEQTRPVGLAGAAVKLRLLMDEDVGIVISEPGEGDIMSLKQVAEFVERETGVASNPKVAAPASIIKEAYQIVNDMEDDLEDARVFADGVAILAAEALHDDPKLGAVFMRHGWQIADHCEALAKRRGELFRLLHPNRDHFEKEGWPG